LLSALLSLRILAIEHDYQIKNYQVMHFLSKNFFLLAAMFLSLTLVTSCGEDDEDPEIPTPDPSTVVANFSSQVDADN